MPLADIYHMDLPAAATARLSTIVERYTDEFKTGFSVMAAH